MTPFARMVDPALLAEWNRGVAKAKAAYAREHDVTTAYGRKLRKAAANRRLKTEARRREREAAAAQ